VTRNTPTPTAAPTSHSHRLIAPMIRVPRQPAHRDHGADERDEDGRPGGNALLPHHERVPELVDEDQKDEAHGERETPHRAVDADHEQHARKGAELQHLGDDEEVLELPEQHGEHDTGGTPAPEPRRQPSLARGGRDGRVLVEHVLGDRAEVLHVAIVRGERPLHRRQPGSRTGAGILHAWYMTIARKTRSKSWNPAEAMRKK